MRYLLYLSLVLLMAACGGGGSDDAPAAPGVPPAEETGGQASPVAPPVAEVVLPTLPPVIIATDEDGLEYSLPPAEEPSFEEQLNIQLAPPLPNVIQPTHTPASEGALPVPLPGTLVASETEEAEPIPDFQQITLLQQGGPADINVRVDIFSDGRVIRDGQTGSVAPGTIAELNQIIRDLNFFGLQGTFLGPTVPEEAYRYRITVISGQTERAINMQDGFMPEEVMRFLGRLRTVGDSVR